MIRFFAVIIGLFVATVTGIALAPTYHAVWDATDRVVEQTNDANFQSPYQTSKKMITTAEDLEDNLEFVKSVLILSTIIGIPLGVIKVIKDV